LVRLLSRAKDEGDWELCKELARFLTALDETGATLMEALEMVDLKSPKEERENSSFMFEGSRLKAPKQTKNNGLGINGIDASDRDDRSSNGSRSPISPGNMDPVDYFSSRSNVPRG
jgi:hypothetical protein